MKKLLKIGLALALSVSMTGCADWMGFGDGKTTTKTTTTTKGTTATTTTTTSAITTTGTTGTTK